RQGPSAAQWWCDTEGEPPMSFRSLSPQAMFEQMARDHTPVFHFQDGTDWAQWKAAALPRVLATLGDFPAAVPPHPQLLAAWEHDGLRKQRWLIDVGLHAAASVQVNFPGGLAPDDKRPALLCWHGHGPFGKEPMMGNDASPALREQIAQHNYNYRS